MRKYDLSAGGYKSYQITREEWESEMSALNHDHDDLAERELTILYATETGNAQDVAERIAVQCRRLHFSVHVYSIDEYRIVGLCYSLPVLHSDQLSRRTTSFRHILFCLSLLQQELVVNLAQ